MEDEARVAAHRADVEAVHEGALRLALPLGDGVDHPLRRRQAGRLCGGRQVSSCPAEQFANTRA